MISALKSDMTLRRDDFPILKKHGEWVDRLPTTTQRRGFIDSLKVYRAATVLYNSKYDKAIKANPHTSIQKLDLPITTSRITIGYNYVIKYPSGELTHVSRDSADCFWWNKDRYSSAREGCRFIAAAQNFYLSLLIPELREHEDFLDDIELVHIDA